MANEVKKSKSQSKPDPDRIRQAKVALAQAKLERYISEIVAEAPDLAAEQRDRLARLLQPVGGAR